MFCHKHNIKPVHLSSVIISTSKVQIILDVFCESLVYFAVKDDSRLKSFNNQKLIVFAQDFTVAGNFVNCTVPCTQGCNTKTINCTISSEGFWYKVCLTCQVICVSFFDKINRKLSGQHQQIHLAIFLHKSPLLNKATFWVLFKDDSSL